MLEINPVLELYSQKANSIPDFARTIWADQNCGSAVKTGLTRTGKRSSNGRYTNAR